jgi:hypothetical protein
MTYEKAIFDLLAATYSAACNGVRRKSSHQQWSGEYDDMPIGEYPNGRVYLGVPSERHHEDQGTEQRQSD